MTGGLNYCSILSIIHVWITEYMDYPRTFLFDVHYLLNLMFIKLCIITHISLWNTVSSLSLSPFLLWVSASVFEVFFVCCTFCWEEWYGQTENNPTLTLHCVFIITKIMNMPLAWAVHDCARLGSNILIILNYLSFWLSINLDNRYYTIFLRYPLYRRLGGPNSQSDCRG
jgi:hypothetical protein